jgi:integrase
MAGLPDRCKPHGLRKAILRRLAERGATAKQIAAVSGHKTLGEVERYTRAADQVTLSKAAVNLLADEEGT